MLRAREGATTSVNVAGSVNLLACLAAHIQETVLARVEAIASAFGLHSGEKMGIDVCKGIGLLLGGVKAIGLRETKLLFRATIIDSDLYLVHTASCC